jgi:hypothetical protein
MKEIIAEAEEQTVWQQPKPDNREWFDEECKIT